MDMESILMVARVGAGVVMGGDVRELRNTKKSQRSIQDII